MAPPYGLPGSAVEAERTGPWPGPPPVVGPDSADDDVYEIDVLAGILYTNLKIIDDGFPTIPFHGVGIGPLPGTIPPAQATLPDDDDELNGLWIGTMPMNTFFMGPPVISLHPATQSACIGTAVTFSVTASPLPHIAWKPCPDNDNFSSYI